MPDPGPRPRYCNRCGYDAFGVPGPVCPECGSSLSEKPSFWCDGQYHYGWALAVFLVPLIVMFSPLLVELTGSAPGFPDRVMRHLYGVQPIGCWLTPLLLVLHICLTVWIAGRGSIVFKESRVGLVLAIGIPADVVALFFHWLAYIAIRGV